MTDLILTEKFSVASDFAKALGVKKKGEGYFEGDEYVITWAVGHLVELYAPDDYDKNLKKWKIETLPLIPEKFKYKPIKRTYRQFKTIKNLLTKKNFTHVIIATDAGREGEVIARTILFESGFLDKSRILRFWTSQALVPEVVRNTMKKLKPVTDYDRLWRAGYYRQVSDWMIGMNCTRVLTVRLKDLFSVGRVQTAVLALLTDRKKERDNFIPKTYWTIKVLFANDKGNWIGHWFKNEDTKLTKKEEAQNLYKNLTHEKSPGVVQSVIKEKKKELPPFLFSLTDLQQEANKKFGFPAKKTLDIAQRLYQDKKCLSYPRTDSRVLGTQNLDMVKNIIKKLNSSYLEIFKNIDQQRLSLLNKRVFNDAKLTDHHALIPFKPLPPGVTGDEKKVFDLVMRRFAAAFHPDCQFENTRVITVFSNETFQTRGKVILVQGWRSVYIEKTKDKDIVEHIPALVQGDTGIAKKIMSDEKQTKPPPEYTDSLLLKDMTNPGRYVSKEAIKKFYRGDIGIGTQSTRAQIIETLISRKYIKRSGKQLLAMDKGCFLVDMLRKCPVSSVLTSPEETARWEMNLNNIALGEGMDTKFLVNIKNFVTDAVNELKVAEFESRNFKTDVQDLVVIGNCPACPLCGGKIIEGKKGYGCANWRPDDGNCLFVIWKEISGKKLSEKNIETLLTGKTTRPYVLKDKTGSKFKAKMRMIQNTQTQFLIEIVPVDEHLSISVFQIPCFR
ncbi:MAG: DNA topoisomerase 3 [Desulfobacula sp.]|uniref:type IA DNA topoisomerase n=1 Tax=Desulfobacula sp. TaxID=2593537 RepID=UPI0025BBFE32|nr:type IA DNA topoisomerase [Desulfobacula sp.]MCD4722375.1 DNA topoisomerase 3 [Desulfobacula sp.]